MGILLDLVLGSKNVTDITEPDVQRSAIDPAIAPLDKSRAVQADVKPATPALHPNQRRALQTLIDSPGLRYVVIVEDEADPVVLALALRDRNGDALSCRLLIPRARFCAFRLLDMMGRHDTALLH